MIKLKEYGLRPESVGTVSKFKELRRVKDFQQLCQCN